MTSDNIALYDNGTNKLLDKAFDIYYHAKNVSFNREKNFIYIKYTLNDKEESFKYNTVKGEIING